MKKVVLFSPPPNFISSNHDCEVAESHPCLCLMYIAKVLEKNNFEAIVVDSSLDSQKNPSLGKSPQALLLSLVKKVEKTRPDFLGVTTISYNMPFVAEFTKLFKARNQDIPLILGGVNPTLLPDETLSLFPHIDYLVRGEGEYTFLELIQKLEKNKSVNDVKGLSFWKDGKIVHTSNRPFIENLDNLPFIDFENYLEIPKNIKFDLLTSRGCDKGCSFCSITPTQGGRFRFFSIDYLRKQIKHLLNLYGDKYKGNCTNLAFYDSYIFSDQARIRKMINMMKNDFPELHWFSYARADCLSRELCRELKKSGYELAEMGIESIIPDTLKFLNKTPDPKSYIQKTKKILRILEEEKIQTYLSFIIGAPNETKEDMLKMRDFVNEQKVKQNTCSIGIGILMVFPGTNMWYKYLNNQITLFRVPVDEGINPFGEKYSNLPWMTPGAFRVENKNMSNEDYAKITNDTYWECSKKFDLD
jgi:radical SAM superfamily enzyme YgiQ (UPF0313 family)